MEAARRRLYEDLPLIGMKSEAACPTCPLNLMCTMGQPLVVSRREQIIYPNGERSEFARTHQNVNKVRVCKACYCVYFEHELHTYLCGIIRTGARHEGRVVKDLIQNALYGNKWPLSSSAISWTKGCSKRVKDKMLSNQPPLTNIASGIYKHDCFAHLKGHFHEVRG
jgi:hypothetical protein